jgi:uncharacterized membrane protein YbhN (UPF0104 family)
MLAKARLSTLAAIIVMIIFNQWLTAWRFQLAVKQCTPVHVPCIEWFRLTCVGQFLNLFVPQFGHVYRAWSLERQHGLAYGDYAIGASVFLWFEVFTGLALACAVTALTDPGLRLGSLPLLVPLVVSTISLLCGPIFVQRLSLGPLRCSTLLQRVGLSIVKARRALADSWFITRYLSVNLLATGVHIAILWLAFYAIGERLGFGSVMFFQVVLKLTSLVFVTPGNIGLTELAYGVAVDAVSGGVQNGIAVAVLIRGISTPVTVALGMMLGGWTFLARNKSRERIII